MIYTGQTQSVGRVRTAHISVCCGLWTLCHTIQHKAVLIIFPLYLQTITITRILSSGGEEDVSQIEKILSESIISLSNTMYSAHCHEQINLVVTKHRDWPSSAVRHWDPGFCWGISRHHRLLCPWPWELTTWSPVQRHPFESDTPNIHNWYDCKRQQAFTDIRLCHAAHGSHCKVQPPSITIRPNVTSSINQKYITYCNAVRGGPTHGHRGSAQQISWRSVQRFKRYAYTDRQTDRQTDRNTLLRYQGRVMRHVIICRLLSNAKSHN